MDLSKKRRSKLTERKKWKRKCLEAWSRYIRRNGVCEKCGRCDGKLDAHHIIPRRTAIHPGWFMYDNGVALCFNCHRNGAHSLDFDEQVDFHSWVRQHLQDKGLDYDRLKMICRSKGKMTVDHMKALHEQMVRDLAGCCETN